MTTTDQPVSLQIPKELKGQVFYGGTVEYSADTPFGLGSLSNFRIFAGKNGGEMKTYDIPESEVRIRTKHERFWYDGILNFFGVYPARKQIGKTIVIDGSTLK